MLKLTVYVPSTHLEKVKEALFAAGAGKYGKYDRCSWQVLGEGQFRPLAGSRPFLGHEGRDERAAEWRLEMILDGSLASAAVAALRASHPYEEPAFSLVQLLAPPEA